MLQELVEVGGQRNYYNGPGVPVRESRLSRAPLLDEIIDSISLGGGMESGDQC